MARNPVTWLGSPAFPKAAADALANPQLRRNLRQLNRNRKLIASTLLCLLPGRSILRKQLSFVLFDLATLSCFCRV